MHNSTVLWGSNVFQFQFMNFPFYLQNCKLQIFMTLTFAYLHKTSPKNVLIYLKYLIFVKYLWMQLNGQKKSLVEIKPLDSYQIKYQVSIFFSYVTRVRISIMCLNSWKIKGRSWKLKIRFLTSNTFSLIKNQNYLLI